MVVTLGLDVCVCHEEHGEDDGNDIPPRQDQTMEEQIRRSKRQLRASRPYLKVSATDPILSGACQVEKATIAGT